MRRRRANGVTPDGRDRCAKRAAVAASVLAMAVCARFAFAGLPFVTDDAGTLGKGASQIEFWYEGGSDKDTVANPSVKSHENLLGATVGHGVAESVDAQLGFARAWGKSTADGAASDHHDTAEIVLNAKWRLLEGREFQVSVKPQVGYSYVLARREDDATSIGGWLIVSRPLGAAAVSVNGGYFHSDYGSAEERDASRSGIWSLSALATFEPVDGLTLGLDAGASTNPDKARSEMPAYVLVGASYSPAESVELAVGCKFGVTEPEPDFSGTAGITFRF